MSDVRDEYRTIVSQAGWAERRERGRLMFTGRDVLPFLQALLTNDVSRLHPGDGAYAAYLTPHGRMLADLELYCRPSGVVAAVARELSASLATRFDQLVFSEDVRISDVSEDATEVLVVGGSAAVKLAAAFELNAQRLDELKELQHVECRDGFVARAGASVLPCFNVLVTGAARTETIRRLEAAGVLNISTEVVEALRIEAGRPRWGVDLTDETIPLEAGLLERAISTSKGCYVGQEIVVRILHRGGGRVARRLVTVHVDSTERPVVGLTLEEDGNSVGTVTSAAPAFSGDGLNALAFVKRDLAEIGKVLRLAGGGSCATVTGFAG